MMTDAQISGAVERVKMLCKLLETNYVMVSLRRALLILGYTEGEADTVINACAKAGFTYCIDPIIPCANGATGDEPRPPRHEACVWGPDQLISRLEFIRV